MTSAAIATTLVRCAWPRCDDGEPLARCGR